MLSLHFFFSFSLMTNDTAFLSASGLGGRAWLELGWVAEASSVVGGENLIASA